MKRILIIANWKMNPASLAEAKRLFDSVTSGVRNIKNAEVIICPPFVYLSGFKSKNSILKLGGQDCFWEDKGPFTGEISTKQLKNLGAEYVILGHSERRKYQKETDEMINKKVRAALAAGLKPILCVESLSQLRNGLKGILKQVIVAYEPVFAIGTGKPCSTERAKKMRDNIKYPVVLYGGSVNEQNASDYIEKAGFQGLLIGGISLRAGEFIGTVKKVALKTKS